MGLYEVTNADYIQETIENKTVRLLRTEKFNQFSTSVLGMGDISSNSTVLSCICAIFDLEGFTNFCKQIDPQLAIPVYLDAYLKWIFEKVKKETLQKEYPQGIKVWHHLPMFMKFMGDGIMILWDIKDIHLIAQRNILNSMFNITIDYKKNFLPTIRKKVSDPPPQLRCGIAKGNIYTVGNGTDFVGPCINLAARLQKMPGLNFSFACRGFSLEDDWLADSKIVVKEVSIRGMSNKELIGIDATQFAKLSPEDANHYSDP